MSLLKSRRSWESMIFRPLIPLLVYCSNWINIVVIIKLWKFNSLNWFDRPKVLKSESLKATRIRRWWVNPINKCVLSVCTRHFPLDIFAYCCCRWLLGESIPPLNLSLIHRLVITAIMSHKHLHRSVPTFSRSFYALSILSGRDPKVFVQFLLRGCFIWCCIETLWRQQPPISSSSSRLQLASFIPTFVSSSSIASLSFIYIQRLNTFIVVVVRT